jgi:hypothetical protein
MAIESLVVFGDSYLIINKVKNIYQAKQHRLKQYRNDVWDLVDNFFLAFNISFIPREANQKEDYLALAVSTFIPPIGPNIKYQVEFRHSTAIPENVKLSQVFSDDLELQIFMHTIEEFSSISIDQEGEDDESKNQQTSHMLNKVASHNTLELKKNHIPRVLVPLKILFDSHDVSRGAAIKNQEEEEMDYNIGTIENPKIVKFSKALAPE